MASLFSAPPKPPKPPRVPTEADPDVQLAKANQRRALAGFGRSRNVLTSPTGASSPAPTQYKTLLGA